MCQSSAGRRKTRTREGITARRDSDSGLPSAVAGVADPQAASVCGLPIRRRRSPRRRSFLPSPEPPKTDATEVLTDEQLQTGLEEIRLMVQSEA